MRSCDSQYLQRLEEFLFSSEGSHTDDFVSYKE